MKLLNEIINCLNNSDNPSEIFAQIRAENQIGYLTELNLLIGCIHDPIWHPEGDVWTHTMIVIDEAAKYRHFFKTNDEKTSYMLAALCHDLGKPYTNDYLNSRIRSVMHDQYGIIPAKSLLTKIGVNDTNIINKVSAYVRYHLVPMQFYKSEGKVSDKAIRKLNENIYIPDLVLLTRADHAGRTDDEAKMNLCPPADYLLDRFKKLKL
ncbi:MAG: HD domain-containing protein [Candidatus Kapabacteria bacterium]|nr:HD domain-containing protein [Ignavibacteriota bacterium]MCW5885390.1 HD domain-containing protein [Candidatus Kapabacteria bacterium]